MSLKSANETRYWLSLIRDSISCSRIKLQVLSLLTEVDEISNMVAASIITLKKGK
ncbi:four helix bundle protein [Patescibacteria group bacterium]|nr:four helix bundle protein [Patescibacteria group bacterium]